MTHYICTGTDKGVGATPGVCQGVGCSKEGYPLEACGCTDGKHYGRQDQGESKEE